MNPITYLKKKLAEFKADSEKRDAAEKATKAARDSLFKREYYPTYISKEAKWRVNILRKTKFLSKAQKDIILPKIKFLAIKLAHLNLIEDRIFYFRDILDRLAVAFLSLSSGFFSFRSIYHNPWNTGSVMSSDLLAGLIISPIILVFYNRLRYSSLEKYPYRTRSRFMFISLILSFTGLVVILSYLGGTTFNLIEYVGYTFLFGVFGLSLIFYMITAIGGLLSYLLNVFSYNKLPESIVVHNILMILNEIERYPELLSELKFKKMAITRLDYIADAISKNIPDLLKTKNNEFNNSIKVISQNIANSIREKKLWVLTPKEDTAHYLANYLANFLFCFAKGDWDTLERLDAPELTLSEKWTKRYLPFLRPIIFIGVPIIVYWALKTYNLLNEPWAGTVVSYSILWVIINIIWLIDPTAKEKSGSLKDATGLF